jgi:hypothetical protein
MSLSTLLAVQAHREGHAQRSAIACHRVLRVDPLLVCLFGLGAEPFAAAALGWGRSEQQLEVAIAGDPRERRLLFPALERLADDLLPYFETPFESVRRVPGPRGGRERMEVDELPQILVPNVETLLLLGRIGRRVRYLPTDGPTPASEELIRLGAHLDFLRKHGARPGQQLVVVASELVSDHWQTSLNSWEARSLPALDAFVEPPPGVHGHEAAAEADRDPLGPRPDARQDAAAGPLIRRLNERRAKSVERDVVEPLLVPLGRHYRPLLERAAEISWRCLRREAAYPTARHAPVREQLDREAYCLHMDLVSRGVRRRARMTQAQAIRHVAELEQGGARLAAQEAVDDPLRMVDVLLAGQAVLGTVIDVDADHRPAGTQGRPLVELALDTPTLLEPGERVHWDRLPEKDWEVTAVGPGRIELMLLNPRARPLPQIGERACFTILAVKDEHFASSPSPDAPWTHVPPLAAEEPGSIEEAEAA